jgi:hypothetical protein
MRSKVDMFSTVNLIPKWNYFFKLVAYWSLGGLSKNYSRRKLASGGGRRSAVLVAILWKSVSASIRK